MRQDAAFYVNGPGHEVVWEKNGNRFFVVRNGEMRIHYSADSENQHIIRYTDQLEAAGVKNDSDLRKFTALGDEKFHWANNSWFEVWDSEDTDYYSEPYHEFTDAVGQAEVLLEESVLENK